MISITHPPLPCIIITTITLTTRLLISSPVIGIFSVPSPPIILKVGLAFASSDNNGDDESNTAATTGGDGVRERYDEDNCI